MNWVELAGSVMGIAGLAGAAKLLGLGKNGTIENAAAAARAAEDALSGFRPVGALVGDDDLAAIVAGDGGRVAVVKRHGVHLAVREIDWAAVRSTEDGIEVTTRDRRFGTVMLTGIDALDIRRMAPALTGV